jgi:hypothetical protein
MEGLNTKKVAIGESLSLRTVGAAKLYAAGILLCSSLETVVLLGCMICMNL